jgi:hypothetical protein
MTHDMRESDTLNLNLQFDTVFYYCSVESLWTYVALLLRCFRSSRLYYTFNGQLDVRVPWIHPRNYDV